MNWLPNLHEFSALLLDRMVVCLVVGSTLVAVVALLLRLLPKRNSQTRFSVWLCALMAIAALPVLGVEWRPVALRHAAAHAPIMIPATWATFLVLLWAVIAIVGLARVVAGAWTLRRLRRACVDVPSCHLAPETRAAVAEFRRLGSISILVSPQVEAPGAIGFLRPAILLPPWLLDDGASNELKHVVLHELAHLRRWDDWTNLAQKLIKALLFFHPGVWWIEQKLALDREMACDDSVLSRVASPRAYAHCLASVAEKSFLRRQYALAQAAVDNARQLSLRVTQILDAGRPQGKGLWKPALPAMAALALLTVFTAARMPELVAIPSPLSSPAKARGAQRSLPAAEGQNAHPVFERGAKARNLPFENAGFDSQPLPVKFTPASYALLKNRPAAGQRDRKPAGVIRHGSRLAPRLTAANVSLLPLPKTALPKGSAGQADGMVVMLVTSRIVPGGQAGTAGEEVVQVNLWEVRWVRPASRPAKALPRKT